MNEWNYEVLILNLVQFNALTTRLMGRLHVSSNEVIN